MHICKLPSHVLFIRNRYVLAYAVSYETLKCQDYIYKFSAVRGAC